jgi:hypothetical protein
MPTLYQEKFQRIEQETGNTKNQTKKNNNKCHPTLKLECIKKNCCGEIIFAGYYNKKNHLKEPAN